MSHPSFSSSSLAPPTTPTNGQAASVSPPPYDLLTILLTDLRLNTLVQNTALRLYKPLIDSSFS